MPLYPTSRDSARNLSISNVISLSLNLYQYHLLRYFRLSFFAHLWLLVPLYGWAKFYATSALISRLVFGELADAPELSSAIRPRVYSKKWKFLALALLVIVLSVSVFALSLAILALIAALGITPFVVFNQDFYNFLQEDDDKLWIGTLLLGACLALGALINLYFYSRLFIAELPLVVEKNQKPLTALKRSFLLTKGSTLRIQLIIIISFLIVTPILLLGIFLTNSFQNMWGTVLPSTSYIYSVMTISSTILLNLLTSAIVMPYWQATKAVVFYEIFYRQEALNIKLSEGSSSDAGDNNEPYF
ncbi:MAG TPA: glycerophosphoryl diester phosphodiesterase membrane domain-containing protein [Waterburya sp.]